MFKVLIALLAIAAVASAQESASAEQNAAPEPYAYAYQTDSSTAAEQRSPDGRVTGYYTITDPTDGRQRRVEYFADESGFHAKVATNEVGTKSENSADVEVQASPPTEAQFVYQAQAPQVQQQQFRQQVVSYQAPAPPQQQQQFVTYQQVVPQQQQRFVSTSTVNQAVPQAVRQSYTTYVQQPSVVGTGYNYGYYPGYGYQNGVYYGGAQNAAYGGYGVANGGSYNYHTPGQYYSRYSSSSGAVQQPASYATVGGGQNVYSRYVSSTNTVPGTAYTYSSGPVATSSRTVTTSSQSGQGSGNLLLLKK